WNTPPIPSPRASCTARSTLPAHRAPHDPDFLAPSAVHPAAVQQELPRITWLSAFTRNAVPSSRAHQRQLPSCKTLHPLTVNALLRDSRQRRQQSLFKDFHTRAVRTIPV